MSVLTDQTGVSTLSVPKVIKDLIADAFLGVAAGLATANIVQLPQDKATAITAGWVVANAVVHSLYRFILKWASA
jgi:formylmethanofuran:tetrahydromethanopterin formyltransferase